MLPSLLPLLQQQVGKGGAAVRLERRRQKESKRKRKSDWLQQVLWL